MYDLTSRPVISPAIKEGQRSRIVRVMANSSQTRQGVCIGVQRSSTPLYVFKLTGLVWAKYSTAVVEIRNRKDVSRMISRCGGRPASREGVTRGHHGTLKEDSIQSTGL